MLYIVRHLTRFRYDSPVAENVMDLYMMPRTDVGQQVVEFNVSTRPYARIHSRLDTYDNIAHFFDVAGYHRELTITARSRVSVNPPIDLPPCLPAESWAGVEALRSSIEFWDWLMPSHFTGDTPLLAQLAKELTLDQRQDPLTTVLQLNHDLHHKLVYAVDATEVDSPIDHALERRRGVCQDYTHIMLALLRNYLHMPCRYVSGYLYHSDDDRSSDGASHAWVEVYLPELGWFGLDPTNNVQAGERHIRVALGRDYEDVPPTRGVFKGTATSILTVRVRVRKSTEVDEDIFDQFQDALPVQEEEPLEPEPDRSRPQQQQQQQQQQ